MNMYSHSQGDILCTKREEKMMAEDSFQKVTTAASNSNPKKWTCVAAEDTSVHAKLASSGLGYLLSYLKKKKSQE